MPVADAGLLDVGVAGGGRPDEVATRHRERHTEPARPTAVSTVTVAQPPHAAVTGAKSSAGSGMPLFHMRLTPSGALRAVASSGGLS